MDCSVLKNSHKKKKKKQKENILLVLVESIIIRARKKAKLIKKEKIKNYKHSIQKEMAQLKKKTKNLAQKKNNYQYYPQLKEILTKDKIIRTNKKRLMKQERKKKEIEIDKKLKQNRIKYNSRKQIK